MKVAIVLNTSWNIYNFRLNLIKALIKNGVEVIAVAPRDTFTSKLTEIGCKYEEVKMDSRGVNPIKDLGLVIELWSIYKRIAPDVILHYTVKPNIYGTFAAGMLKIPMINNVCGLGTVFLKDGLVSKIASLLYKIAFRLPKKVFFQNADDFKLFRERKLIREKLGEIIPGSGLDLKKYSPESTFRREKGAPFTFLVISRLIYDKGILEYIEAIKILNEKGINARFQLIGGKDPEHKRGISLAEIQGWIDKKLVEYLGTTEDVRPFIHKADCVVLPSYREGLPRTLLEAAGCGKAIVTTDTAGCKNVVENGENGFLCNIKDPVDLAAKMEKMTTCSPDEIRQMGNKGRTRVEQMFDDRLIIEKYLHAINELKN